MFDKDMVNIISHLYFHPRATDRATKQVLHCYHDTVGPLSDNQVVTVVNDEWMLTPGVIGFLKMAESSLAGFPPKDWIFGSTLRDPLSQPPPKLRCFVAMPYGPRWFPKVRGAIQQVAKAKKCEFDIANDIAKPGGIMLQIWNSIRLAHVIVADLTGLNANVLYEVGIAHALGKEVILITQNKKKLPFDVRGMRWIDYKLLNLGELKKKLGNSLTDVGKELALPKTNAY